MRQGVLFRVARRAPLALFSLAALLAAVPARAAAPKDAQAEKAIKEALDVDYLETKFDRAEKKLRAAIDACGEDKCSPAVKAQAYVALGVVLAGGKKELEDAREAFVDALTLDKTAQPDPDVLSAEVAYTYDQARKQLKLDAGAQPSGPKAPSGQGISHTPPAEQRLDTPVPLYASITPELLDMAKKATVTYRAPGSSDWKTLQMKRLGERGFGINIPCGDIKAEGELQYFISVLDDQGAIITGTGTREQPLKTAIKQRIESSPPSWPGFAPPEVCVKVEKGPNQCLDDNQCNAGYTCVAGECMQPPEKPSENEGPFRNWVTMSFGPDIAVFSGENVCVPAQQDAQHFVCIRQDGSRYAGVPTPNIADNVNGGLALSTLRLTLGYERLFLDNITAGARVGFAFRTQSDDDAVFMPFHAEVRGSYFIGRKPFERLGARPYVTLAVGFGQFDTPVNVEVLEDGAACGAKNPNDIASPCTKPTDLRRALGIEERQQTLTAFKQAGRGFVAAGGGLQYAPLDRVAINIGVRAGVTFPVAVFVLTPEFSVTTGF